MDNNPIDISIVVPVYNSAQTIRELVERVCQAMKPAGLGYELILTDDCSTDNSWQVIAEICSSDKHVVGLRLSKNSGQWCASLAGMSMATGKYIVTIDDDLEYNPDDIPVLYNLIVSGDYGVVFGIAEDKYTLQKRNRIVSKLRNKFVNILWNKPLTDSFKIMKRSLVFHDTCFLVQEPFEVFISHNLNKQFWSYCPVRFNRRYAGNSNYSFLKKVKLFFLYNSYYVINPIRRILILVVLFSFLTTVAGLLFINRLLNHCLLISILPVLSITGIFILYYLASVLSKPGGTILFIFAERLNCAGLSPQA